METIQEPTIITLDGVNYDASNASQETMALIQDLSTIQAEMNRIKVSYDIASLARQAIMEKTNFAIAGGESGLVKLDDAQESQETTDETLEA